MENIMTYLSDRCQDSFEKRPFCDADNLILSILAYIDFDGIVSQEPVSVAQAAAIYASPGHVRSTESVKRLPQLGENVLCEMAKTRRFQALKLSCYVDVFDVTARTQFAALLIGLGDGTAYASYRGTDQSVCGWQESFATCYEAVPAQKLAADYLARVASLSSYSFRVGGHSKGGNLAMYAAMMAPEDIDDRIIAVYNNDGPGFAPDLPWAGNFQKIQGRTTRIIPEFSVVGMIYPQESKCIIVGSNAEECNQHSPLTWEVSGCDFVEKEELSEQCKFANGYLHRWVDGVNVECRSTFVQEFFGAFTSEGVDLIDDITSPGSNGNAFFLKVFFKSGGKTKYVFLRLIYSYVSNLVFTQAMHLLASDTTHPKENPAPSRRRQLVPIHAEQGLRQAS